MVDPCNDDIYSEVVSIESLRSGFLISQLNDLNICAADISNAYLFDKAKEMVYLLLAGIQMEGRILTVDKAMQWNGVRCFLKLQICVNWA